MCSRGSPNFLTAPAGQLSVVTPYVYADEAAKAQRGKELAQSHTVHVAV